jgi:hypothetical protein
MWTMSLKKKTYIKENNWWLYSNAVRRLIWCVCVCFWQWPYQHYGDRQNRKRKTDVKKMRTKRWYNTVINCRKCQKKDIWIFFTNSIRLINISTILLKNLLIVLMLLMGDRFFFSSLIGHSWSNMTTFNWHINIVSI